MLPRTRIALGALAIVTVAHWHAHVGYLRRLNTIDVPEVELPVPVEVPVEPARRLHVLIVDGLGYDKAMEVPEIARLAESGVSRVMHADFPSFTHPSITSMATGRPPRFSGVRINGPKPPLPWDSVSKRAAASGIRVGVWDQGFRNFSKLLLLPPEIPEAGERELEWIYFGDVDKAAHHSGTASEEYETARTTAGRRVEELFARIDPARDALVVVSDHGHRREGGHGGEEPEALRALFLAVGGPFPKGVRLPPAPMKDLASTLCGALGIAPPRDALGTAMLDAFGLAPARDDADARAEVAAYRATFSRAARVRLALAALAALLLGTLAVRSARDAGLPLEPRDFAPALVFAAAFAIGYRLWGYQVTWSVPRSQPVYQSVTALIAFASIGAALVAARRDRRAEEALAMTLALGAIYLLTAAWVGPGTSRIAGPFASFLLLVVITVLFYPLLFFAIRALYAERRGWRTAASVTFGGLVLFAAPFFLRWV